MLTDAVGYVQHSKVIKWDVFYSLFFSFLLISCENVLNFWFETVLFLYRCNSVVEEWNVLQRIWLMVGIVSSDAGCELRSLHSGKLADKHCS